MLDLRSTQLPKAFLIIHRCESQWIKKSKWFACTDLLRRLEWRLCCQNNRFCSCPGSVETNQCAKCAKNLQGCHPVVHFENLCLHACAADTTRCETNLAMSLDEFSEFLPPKKTEDSAENDQVYRVLTCESSKFQRFSTGGWCKSVTFWVFLYTEKSATLRMFFKL